MGINYSLCSIIAREQASSALQHLSLIVAPKSSARIEHLKWEPAKTTKRKTLIGTAETDSIGIRGLELEEKERENNYCLSLHVQLEAEMETHLGGRDFDCFDSPGPFGCMWTSFYAGTKFTLIEMTAATSRMSHVIKESKAIHELWRTFSIASGAMLAYVDMEDDGGISLHPKTNGDIFLPDANTLAYIDNCRFAVDPFAEFALAVNGE